MVETVVETVVVPVAKTTTLCATTLLLVRLTHTHARELTEMWRW